MKKLLFGLSLVLILAGCGGDTTQKEGINENVKYEPDLWKDTETGCEYLIVETGSYDGGVSIIPRMGADGTQICN